jgi:hypothetical protein
MEWASEYGALGFWAALEKTIPDTCQHRCWGQKQPTCLTAFLQSNQAKAKTTLHDIWCAEAKEKAAKTFALFVQTFEVKPKSDGLFAIRPNRIVRLLRRSSSSLAEYPNDTSNRVRRRRMIKAPNTGIDRSSPLLVCYANHCRAAERCEMS